MKMAYPIEIFYDGSCVVCNTEMQVFRKRNPQNRLRFVDISAPDFSALDYGKTQEELMEKLHVLDKEGRFVTGIDAFMVIWQAYPSGSVYRLLSAFVGFPGINLLSRCGYTLFARNRHLLPKRKKQCPDGSCQVKDPR